MSAIAVVLLSAVLWSGAFMGFAAETQEERSFAQAGTGDAAGSTASPRFRFRVHEIARPGGRSFGQTSAADVDKDGGLDFITGRQFGDLFWFEKHSADRWYQHKIGETAQTDVGGVAFDGDGDNDVARVDRVDRWLENADGKGGSWLEHLSFDFGKEGPWGIQTRAALTDVDGDGDLDLIQAEGDVLDGRVAWFENLHGNGSAWDRHLIKQPGHKQDFHSLCVADFDGDGDQDIFDRFHAT